jgi:hypothetical protein
MKKIFESFKESLLKTSSINEGEFSWLTHDTKQQIGSDPQNTINVYMFDDQGNMWVEKNYEGYGVFGGKDFYELMAEMNGYTIEDLKGKEDLRDIGISLNFDKKKQKNGKKVLYPALVTNKNYNWKRHDFTEEPERDPNQGWFVGYDDEDEDYNDYDKYNETIKENNLPVR